MLSSPPILLYVLNMQGDEKKKLVTISEWILMSPHFHQRLCLTAVNNHFEDSQYPQVSSTEPPRPAMCSGRVNHEDTNTEVFVRGGRLKESWWTLRLGATWLRLHGFYDLFLIYFCSSLTWILSPGYQHRKRDPKKNERKTFRAASQLQIKSWKKYFLNCIFFGKFNRQTDRGSARNTKSQALFK